MLRIFPQTPEEAAEALRASAAARQQIRIEGNNSKHRAGGAGPEPNVVISTARLDRVLQYEPKDLTISVGAGMPYARFREMLAADGMMTPLDPPFAEQATVGGVIAANSSGPRRRLYGTARDLVIGMTFANLQGKIVSSGGMVVKNVAGLDMAKLFIGSLGTLGLILSINFKLIPKPPGTRTFLFETQSAAQAIEIRNRLLRSVLTPAAVDLLNPAAAANLGFDGWLLAVGASGNAAVLDRFERELSGAQVKQGAEERAFWEHIEEFSARFLQAHPSGAVVRVSTTLEGLAECVARLPGSVIARAANGVSYAHLTDAAQAPQAYAFGKAVMEFGPENRDPSLLMWPAVDSGFVIMERIKKMFDPDGVLNIRRMYGRL
ncbi:MAG: FAD-binding oxidoreductase [Bryobacteraceae bacterium]|nr:FAD-binding oxidoreductase [Bryobacteraceae bacterium]MDW8379959.1 FAD-binding oxidoreductase [Bryobacterales bacterium]